MLQHRVHGRGELTDNFGAVEVVTAIAQQLAGSATRHANQDMQQIELAFGW